MNATNSEWERKGKIIEKYQNLNFLQCKKIISFANLNEKKIKNTTILEKNQKL